MLHVSCYAQNYAGIICQGLVLLSRKVAEIMYHTCFKFEFTNDANFQLFAGECIYSKMYIQTYRHTDMATYYTSMCAALAYIHHTCTDLAKENSASCNCTEFHESDWLTSLTSKRVLRFPDQLLHWKQPRPLSSQGHGHLIASWLHPTTHTGSCLSISK